MRSIVSIQSACVTPIPPPSQHLFPTRIFQQSLKTVQLPEDWEIAKVIPVLKSVCRSSPTNYRHISFTCVSSRITKHIILKHLFPFLKSNFFFTVAQHRFRRSFLSETQVQRPTKDVILKLSTGNRIRSPISLSSLKRLTGYRTTHYFWAFRH